MSFHHYRRLTEHWPDNTKKLTPAAVAVAITISNHLDADTNHWAMSAQNISKWTNDLAPSTVQRAVRALVALGVFQVSRERQRRPNDYRLLVACPSGCERLAVHNTPSELRALAKPTKKASLESTQSDTSKAQSTQSDHTQAFNLTNSVEQIELTNRTSIEPLIEKDDRKKSFEILFITETLQHLRSSNTYKADHAALEKALLEIPEQVEEKAQAIMAKADGNPRNYLESSITKHPLSLIPKQDKQTSEDSRPLAKAKFGRLIGDTSSGELQSYWQKLQVNQDLVEWSELSNEHIDFLARLYKEHTPLTNTAANLVSEAVEKKIHFSPYWQHEPNGIKPPRSITELSEILKEHEAKQLPAVQ